ncbi:MAG: hypothetical protein JWP61_558 [Friedmanniella sp.]|nr:hypothetical protein [Friedmanniella sp.]
MTTTISPQGLAAPPPRPPARGHALVLIAGVLLGLLGLILAGLASASGWALYQQRDGRFLTSPVGRYAVSTSALTTTGLEVFVDSQLPTARPGAARLMVRASGADPARPVFVGIGPRDAVTAYLAGVEHSELTQVTFAPFTPTYRTVPGTRAPARPADQSFWLTSAAGAGQQQVETPLRSGTWVVVVMNADGSPGVAADLTAGVQTDLLGPVTLGLAVAALILLGAAVVVLLVGAGGLGRAAETPVDVAAEGPSTGLFHSPVRLRGRLEAPSRWLWLVKWLLLVPHALVLLVLWPVVVLFTLAAAVAILITGRYPRPLFDLVVGVLRWNWRVTFYGYSALGTDRYPPFALGRADYPADLEVEYPGHLSRGLVLVKSWLLALPHLLIVGVLTAPWSWTAQGSDTSSYRQSAGLSLLGLLTLVAALALLFTGRYPRPLFDLVLGLNRWVYRVLAYVLLLRDDYPPFRLDQGPREPDDPDPDAPTVPAPAVPESGALGPGALDPGVRALSPAAQRGTEQR